MHAFSGFLADAELSFSVEHPVLEPRLRKNCKRFDDSVPDWGFPGFGTLANLRPYVHEGRLRVSAQAVFTLALPCEAHPAREPYPHFNPKMGFQVTPVDEMTAKQVECPLCTGIWRQPTELPCCGFVACRGCLSQCSPRVCPHCRKDFSEEVSVSFPLPSASRDRMAQALTVHCPAGCPWTGELRCVAGTQGHFVRCPEVLVSCIRGCGAVIKRCTLAEHMKGECLHESVPCPLGGGCGALVMRKDLDRHCAEKEHETSLVKELERRGAHIVELEAEVARLRARVEGGGGGASSSPDPSKTAGPSSYAGGGSACAGDGGGCGDGDEGMPRVDGGHEHEHASGRTAKRVRVTLE